MTEHVCRAPGCGSTNVEAIWREEREQFGLRCRDCGRWTWEPKAGNENKRSDHNAKHRAAWKAKLGGELVCAWCGARESEVPTEWHVDHIVLLDDGGDDVFENTIVYCQHHHNQRHSERNFVGRFRIGRAAA